MNQYINRPLTFNPHLLIIERKKAEELFEKAEKELLIKKSRVRLPKLLEEIRNLTMEEEQIRHFANKLSKLNMKLIMYEYPYHNEDDNTKWKIINILMFGYNRQIGRTAWETFQQIHQDKYLLMLIKYIFQNENESYLALDENSRDRLDEAFNKDEPKDALIKLLIESVIPAGNLLQKMKVKDNQPLAKSLIKGMLLYGLTNKKIIVREGTEKIISYLSDYSLEEYKQVILNYLNANHNEDFNFDMIKQAIERISDPRKNEKAWYFAGKEVVEKVKHWLRINELERFFDQDQNNARFSYWKNHSKQMKDVVLIKKPSIIFMYFNNFVVVEFGNIGAAYFYHIDGFNEALLPRKDSKEFRRSNSIQRKEAMFKEKKYYTFNDTPLYIHKLDHRGNWYIKFDYHIHEYLAGNLNYVY